MVGDRGEEEREMWWCKHIFFFKNSYLFSDSGNKSFCKISKIPFSSFGYWMLNSILFYFLLLFFPFRGLTPLGVEIQRWWQARDNSISLQPFLVKVQFPCLQTAEDPLPAVQPPAGPLPRDTVQHPKGCHHTGKSWHLLHWIEDNVYPNFSLRNDYKILGNANVWKPMFFAQLVLTVGETWEINWKHTTCLMF